MLMLSPGMIELLFVGLVMRVAAVSGMRTHFVYWNTTNPAFRQQPEGNVLEVNRDKLGAGEHDQLHLICPTGREQHVIYAVSEEEYRACRVSSPRPKIVAVCNQPHRFRYFTLTFRSFSPNPTALEFKPGQSYYLVSTSTPRDLHRRAGGFCSTHNMRMTIKVAESAAAETAAAVVSTAAVAVNKPAKLSSAAAQVTASPFVRAFTGATRRSKTTSKSVPVYYYRSKTPAIHASDYIYYYSPRDLVQLKLRAKKHDKGYRDLENETLAADAQRLTSSAVGQTSCLTGLLVTLAALICTSSSLSSR